MNKETKEYLKDSLKLFLYVFTMFLAALFVGFVLNGCAHYKKDQPWDYVETTRGALACDDMCYDIGGWMHRYRHYSNERCVCADLSDTPGFGIEYWHVYKGPQGDTKKVKPTLYDFGVRDPR